MTTSRQLYALQEMDLALDRIQGDINTAGIRLSSGLGMEHLENALQEENDRLLQAQTQHRLQRLEAETQRERSTRLDVQLYSGAITSPKDLESLEREASNVRGLLERQDAQLLELSMQVEASQTNLDALAQELVDSSSAWENRNTALRSELQRWTAEREALVTQRDQLADTLDAASLQRYEALRRAKGGLAVAKVERGLCQTCRMSLPTQQQQRLRNGRQTVLCNSCGRILFLNRPSGWKTRDLSRRRGLRSGPGRRATDEPAIG